MKATVYHATGDVRVEHVPDPKIVEPTDAIVRVTHACICGSDLWFYRGDARWETGWRTGHELMGVVEEVGRAVRTVRKGDRVLAPFAFSDGTCEFCRAGVQTSCVHGGFWGGAKNDGGQGEAVRSPFADGTLVKIPAAAANDEGLLTALLPLTDVLGTGHHAAVSAGVKRGTVTAVVGDGAVGLCAVLAAKRLGAERILLFGRHPARLDIAKRFGATDIVTERGDEAIARALELTNGGPAAVLECVGNAASMAMASGMTRPGGTIGFVGVPYGAHDGLNLRRMFSQNIALRGGVAPVRAYIPELMEDVLAGTLDASPVFDRSVDLAGVPDGYAAMDARTAVKVLVRP
ncbi:MAG: zinc-dependent alcohol dehydrogenase family protein [Candidatus Eremiobacteraeota bacterium]|nr:zinc-dependent alcohol dehydrogenase family protein [Candidatus Eremiobacteraeota bacterium]